MPEAPLPTLDQDLTEEHSRDCLNSNLFTFSDIEEMVQETITQLREDIGERIIETNLDFAAEADDFLSIGPSYLDKMESILSMTSDFQRMIRESDLSDDEKESLWRPIAECYAQVQNLLSERIKPIKEQERWQPGTKK